jgi:alanyl-tRNA synthetase
VEYTQREHHLLRQISSDLRVAPDEVPERINRLADQIRQLERENRELRQKLLRGETQVATGAVEEINGIKVLIREMPDLPSDELQTAMDAMMENASNQVAVLAVASDGKVTFVCAVSDDLTHTLNAGQIAKEMAQITGGGGGGRKNRAQAGGKDPSKMPQAIERMKEIIRQVKAAR